MSLFHVCYCISYGHSLLINLKAILQIGFAYAFGILFALVVSMVRLQVLGYLNQSL
jgi:hypothetical protein